MTVISWDAFIDAIAKEKASVYDGYIGFMGISWPFKRTIGSLVVLYANRLWRNNAMLSMMRVMKLPFGTVSSAIMG